MLNTTTNATFSPVFRRAERMGKQPARPARRFLSHYVNEESTQGGLDMFSYIQTHFEAEGLGLVFCCVPHGSIDWE